MCIIDIRLVFISYVKGSSQSHGEEFVGGITAKVCVVSVHPGTVDTDLTRQFLEARAKYEVQPVHQAANDLASTFASLAFQQTGTFIDWSAKPSRGKQSS